jgi:hypothetical protein
MRARAKGRTFEDRSWNGIVSRVVAAFNLNTTAAERTAAARDLMDRRVATVGGVSINPL